MYPSSPITLAVFFLIYFLIPPFADPRGRLGSPIMSIYSLGCLMVSLLENEKGKLRVLQLQI